MLFLSLCFSSKGDDSDWATDNNQEKYTSINPSETSGKLREIDEVLNSKLFHKMNLPNGVKLNKISVDIKTKLKNRCPVQYKKVNSSLESYNDVNIKSYNIATIQQDSVTQNDLNQMQTSTDNIKTALKECVTNIRQDYIDLYNNFTLPLIISYSSNKTLNKEKSMEEVFYHAIFLKDIKNYFPDDNSKAGQIRKQILAYLDFTDKCIIQPGSLSALESNFNLSSYDPRGGGTTIKTKYDFFADFLKKESGYCLPELKKLKEFSESQVFKEFISLPGKCKEDKNTEVESFKKALLLNEENTNSPNVMSYCKGEWEKTANFCYCGEEDCSSANKESLFTKIYQGSKDICGKGSLNNEALSSCKSKANKCSTKCNDRFKEFEKKYKDFFFVPNFELNSRTNIHYKFNTACKDDLKEIERHFQQSLTKPPFNRDELKGVGSLASLSKTRNLDLGIICQSPFEDLKERYESLDCSEEEKKEEEDKKKEEDKNQEEAQKNSAYQPSWTGGGWGASSRSQEDEIRQMYAKKSKNPYSPSPSHQDSQEFNYSQTTDFNNYSGDGSSNGSSFGGSSFNKGEGYKSKRDQYKTGQSGAEESYLVDSKSKDSKADDPTDLSGGEEGSSSKGSLTGGILNAPSQAWNKVKDKAKEIGSEADKRLRDYLLSDNKGMLQYKHGYRDVRTNEEKRLQDSPSTGIRGLPRNLREKAYEAYNKIAPIQKEEWRKRMGLMHEDVDLFEVQDLLFLRACYTLYNKEECDEPDDPKAEGRTLETVITRYNELAGLQLITPSEEVKMQINKERRGLTKDQDLQRMMNSLDETERKAKKTREQMGLAY